jgi:prepilin-type N-terminal cleavage/methylation domain-containing protein
MMRYKLYLNKGFTLVEMAVVLVIMGFLVAGLLVPLSTQIDQRSYTQTQKSLDEIKQALIGYAIINGRLPCPASDTSDGIEDSVGGVCTHPYDGFLPAATLGITPTDANGYALDGWSSNTPNRIRYAVTVANGNAFTTAINSLSFLPNLHVCASGTSITPAACDASVPTLTSDAVAVIFSLGKNATTGGVSIDEAPNVDNNITFVSHEFTTTFDDQMTWISYPILVNSLVNAGKLP